MAVRNQTILLVDDEPDQRELMRLVLENAGFRVVLAADYSGAKAVYERFRTEIELLLIDVCLPGRNGIEFANEVRAANPGIKVLLMSGYTGAYVCRFYGIPATDVHFLEKPFKPADLLARIKRVLESTEPRGGSAAATGSW